MRFVLTQFVRHIVPGILKPMRVLWNEVIGALFLAFALVPVPRTYRAWRDWDQSGEGLFNLAVSLVFMTIMTVFGVGSFLRARKISRS